jgi:cyclase
VFGNGYEVCTHNGKTIHKLDPILLATQLQDAGAGEIVVNSVDRDGQMQGYDLELAIKFKQALTLVINYQVLVGLRSQSSVQILQQ